MLSLSSSMPEQKRWRLVDRENNSRRIYNMPHVTSIYWGFAFCMIFTVRIQRTDTIIAAKAICDMSCSMTGKRRASRYVVHTVKTSFGRARSCNESYVWSNSLHVCASALHRKFVPSVACFVAWVLNLDRILFIALSLLFLTFPWLSYIRFSYGP
jgi:hypothetical protein